MSSRTLYLDDTYLAKNPGWHVEESPLEGKTGSSHASAESSCAENGLRCGMWHGLLLYAAVDQVCLRTRREGSDTAEEVVLCHPQGFRGSPLGWVQPPGLGSMGR